MMCCLSVSPGLTTTFLNSADDGDQQGLNESVYTLLDCGARSLYRSVCLLQLDLIGYSIISTQQVNSTSRHFSSAWIAFLSTSHGGALEIKTREERSGGT